MSATPPRKERSKQNEKELLARLEAELADAKLLKTVYNPKHPLYNADLAEDKILWENPHLYPPAPSRAANKPRSPSRAANKPRSPSRAANKPRSPESRKRKRNQMSKGGARAATTRRRRV